MVKWSVSPGYSQSSDISVNESKTEPIIEALLVRLASSSTCLLSTLSPAVHPVPMARDLQVICDSSLFLSNFPHSADHYVLWILPLMISHISIVFSTWLSYIMFQQRLAVAFSLVSKTPFFSPFKSIFHTNAEIIY